MRKELFKHEIAILKDTFGRLLRRHAQTNLVNLINKTHPADLAIVFRYFNDEEQKQVFSLMQTNGHTVEFLVELDDDVPVCAVTVCDKKTDIHNKLTLTLVF